MHTGVGLRRLLAALCAVLPLAAASLPAFAADTEFSTLRDQWTATLDAVGETTTNLEALDAATAQAVTELETVRARLADARRRLLKLRGDLRDAVAAQGAAEAANLVAIQRLGQATMILVTIEDALVAHGHDLDVEVVAAYKYGTSGRFGGVVDALISSQSLTEFTTAYDKLQASTVDQAQLVEVVAALATRVDDQRDIVGALQRQAADAELRAVRERSRVAALTREQTRLVDAVARDKRAGARLVAHLERQTARVSRRLDELQAQSEQLRAELAKYRYVGGAPGTNELWWPTDGASISGFGYRTHPIFGDRRMHAGIDIPGPIGQRVYAAREGIVRSAGVRGGYGNVIVLDHGDGMSTVYAHLSSFGVGAGGAVRAGDEIGRVGSTGNSTGPHLHFEVRLGGAPTDPLAWL